MSAGADRDDEQPSGSLRRRPEKLEESLCGRITGHALEVEGNGKSEAATGAGAVVADASSRTANHPSRGRDSSLAPGRSGIRGQRVPPWGLPDGQAGVETRESSACIDTDMVSIPNREIIASVHGTATVRIDTAQYDFVPA